ncbi:MAG: hypothetical protein AMXMBFR64_40580 [Myxococcales bacterium]
MWRFIVVLLLVISGCTRYARPRSLESDPAIVLSRIEARRQVLPTLAVDARASYYAPEGARKGAVVLVVQRPAALRFEALSPTDDLVAILTSDGERFTQHERGSDLCHTGPACPRNIGRLLPLPLRGEDIVHVLLGGTPLIAHTAAEVGWDEDDGLAVLRLRGDGVEQEIGADPCSWEVYRSEIRKGGDVVMSLTFDDWRPVGDARLPHVLQALMPAQDVDLKLVYRAVDPGVEVDAETFRYPCPAGTRPVELPCE